MVARGFRDSSLRGKAEAIHENKKIDCHDFATQNLAMTGKGNSSLRGESMDSPKQSKQNNRALAQPNLARFVVQKIGFKGRSSASADFLLEKELRGSPPKSEKRQLLETQLKYLGGAEAVAAALLRKEISESISKKIVGDSRIAKMDCHELLRNSRNDKSSVDCHDSVFAKSRNDGFLIPQNRTCNDRFILTRSKF